MRCLKMLRPCLSQVTIKNESYYSIVVGVAKRAREISEDLAANGKPLEEKPVKTAVDELASRKYYIVEDPSLRSSGKAE